MKYFKLLLIIIQALYLFFMKMIEQFHRVLRTPKPTTAQTLGKTQDLILCTFEEIFPESFDLQCLHKIYEEILGPNAIPGIGQIEITMQEQICLNYKLVQYFVCLIKSNFVNIDVYRALQEQTQKAQSMNRAHIKIQQQLKMYLDYLESKMDKMHKQLYNGNQSPENLRREIQILQSRQFLLQKQKISLIKKNQKLQTEILALEKQIQMLLSSKQSGSGGSASKSIESRKVMDEINIATQKNQDGGISEIHGTDKKETNKLSARSAYDRQSYRNSAHDYDLTQKKKSVYFPSKK